MELPYRPARGCAPQRPMCGGCLTRRRARSFFAAHRGRWVHHVG